jgi:hypothetical protein
MERAVTTVFNDAVENSQPEVQIAAENVVQLADYRAKRRARAARAATMHGWGPQYYCLRCDGDEFKLYASGVVHCSQCGSLMRNLFISGGKSEEPAR